MTRALAVATSAALVLGGVLLTASPAAAANPEIPVTNDLPLVSDTGSLAWAIDKANTDAGADVIVFQLPTPGPWTITVPAATPLPDPIESLTITGPGSADLTVVTTDGATSAFIANGCTWPDLTDFQVTGMTIADFAGIAVDTSCLNLVAGDLHISGSGLYGLSFSGLAGNTANLTDITSDTNNTGVYLSSPTGASVTATRVSTNGNSNYGLAVDAGGGLVDIGDSTSTLNGLDGFDFNASNSATVTAHGLTASQNSEFGIYVIDNSGASITISGSDTDDNDQGDITGSVSDSSLTITGTSATGSTGAGGIGLDAHGDADIHLLDVTVSGNIDSGADISLVGSTLEIADSTFDSNGFDSGGVVASDGGGLLLSAEINSAITIARSSFTNNQAGFGGGLEAILDSDSTLDISASHINTNQASDCGCFGSGVGGGIYLVGVNGDDSRFTLTDSEVVGNVADDNGGGIYLEDLGVDSFGAVGPTGGVTVLRTTIDDNQSTNGDGGGVYVDNWSWKTDPGDPAGSLPAIVFDQSTLSNNTAASGSAIFADKGTDDNNNVGILLLANSTVANNTADIVASVYVQSAFDDGELRITHSTIAANLANSIPLAGVFYAGDGALTLDHALIADNDTYDVIGLGPGPMVTSSWSLVEGDPLALFTGTGDVTGVDPLLSPLANNGGPTKTMLIAPGSPAYDAGDPAFAGSPANDQRGQARVFQRIDIGAVEWHPALALTGGGPNPTTPLIALLLLFIGTAFVAGSRLRALP